MDIVKRLKERRNDYETCLVHLRGRGVRPRQCLQRRRRPPHRHAHVGRLHNLRTMERRSARHVAVVRLTWGLPSLRQNRRRTGPAAGASFFGPFRCVFSMHPSAWKKSSERSDENFRALGRKFLSAQTFTHAREHFVFFCPS